MESKKKTWKKVLDIVSNVIFVIVMILLVIFMIYGFGSISQDKVPSFFGQYYMRIASGSMSDPAYRVPGDEDSELIADGFERYDVVIINRVDTKDIQIGDIIAFYESSLNYDEDTFIPVEEADPESIRDIESSGSRYSGSRTFHQVVDIEVDEDGYLWFTTKGTHNTGVDSDKVRADYVIGVYTDSGLAGVLQFMSSTAGIIILVVVPSCIVLFLLLLSIIDTIDKMIKKKKEEEAFQDALINSISSSNVSTASIKKYPTSAGGLSESSMAGFEKEIAKIESERKAKEQQKAENSTPPKKPEIKKDDAIKSGAEETSIDKDVSLEKAKVENKTAPKEAKSASEVNKEANASEDKPSEEKVAKHPSGKGEIKRTVSKSSESEKKLTTGTATSKSKAKNSAGTTKSSTSTIKNSTSTVKNSTSTRASKSKSSAKNSSKSGTSSTKTKSSTKSNKK